MSVSFVGFSWAYIGPGQTVGIYLQGFSPNDFAAYCITPSSGNRPGFVPKAQLTVGPVQVHVDGTIARIAYVENQSVSNGGPPTPFVDLNVMLETLQ